MFQIDVPRIFHRFSALLGTRGPALRSQTLQKTSRRASGANHQAVPGRVKFRILGISPLTGTFADTAAGASRGTALKDAGTDLLMPVGQADSPMTIQILDEKTGAGLTEPRRIWN